MVFKIRIMRLRALVVLLIAASVHCLGCFGTYRAFAQKPAKQSPKQDALRSNFSLRVSTKDLIILSLKADKAPLARIAAEISKQLKIPVLLGRSVQTREVTTDFKSLTLEPSMNLLAPAVYIDYEINSAPGAQPQPIGIYLHGYDDSAPALNAVVPNRAEAILIEGHTEEGVDESQPPKEEEEPLRVVYERNSLSVKARKQVLSVVLYRIASELGIPLEIKTDADHVVDLDINKMPLEDAFLRLSPQVRLYVRADLQRMERKPFRIVLLPHERS